MPSAGLIPHHPTAPMFTNSGMIQFVPYFLGEEAPPYTRATSVQKCVRAGGQAQRHRRDRATRRAPQLLRDARQLQLRRLLQGRRDRAGRGSSSPRSLGLDGDRLWVTVHVSDDEAEAIWHDVVGFPRERIQRLDKDNFWEMGETGPCGPCSEILCDCGPEWGAERRSRARRRATATSRSGTSCSCSTTGSPTAALGRSAEEEHRHRRRPRAHPRAARRQPVVFDDRRAAAARRRGRAPSPARALRRATTTPTVACASSPTTPAR